MFFMTFTHQGLLESKGFKLGYLLLLLCTHLLFLLFLYNFGCGHFQPHTCIVREMHHIYYLVLFSEKAAEFLRNLFSA